ncbi:Heterochromatin protein 1-binding protein 3 [Oryzias melastigma]|uniref:Heterochromatin protein 1-binding protein 3 n=1 Tax=Oryzias melastigma TaxID=30732 RepID=A0A834KXE8_ORYME|nr:Heterochromatin protein 1-binding protein 3 [Oryzias melastigma]
MFLKDICNLHLAARPSLCLSLNAHVGNPGTSYVTLYVTNSLRGGAAERTKRNGGPCRRLLLKCSFFRSPKAKGRFSGMPIRRAAATPSQEKAPAAAVDKEPEASEESPPAEEEEQAEAAAAPADGDEEQQAADEEPTENGDKAEEGAPDEEGDEGKSKKDDKCKDCAAGQCSKHCYVLLLRMKDGYKYKKSKTKKVKRTIPLWASVTTHKNVPVTNFAGTQHRMDNILIEALRASSDKSGVSFRSLMKYLLNKHPGMELSKKTFFIKKALKKHLEKGTIKQLKGKGLSGSFVIGKQPTPPKKPVNKLESLGDALPLIITQLCEPKEASYNLIKKYLEQHFPSFNIENKPEALKMALVKAVERGLLEQITGTGARGTFQLKRGGNKPQVKGSVLEEAITAAITAMNEPKTCSTTLLRKYLLDSHKDMKEHHLMATLRRTLKKCKVLGWMEQITGHGFTGTYQLSFPYYPSPNTLFPDKFKEPERPQPNAGRRLTQEASAQGTPPPPPAKKARSSGPARGRGKAIAKKSPAKKAPPPAKKAGRKQPAIKKEPADPKETPVKRGAPSRKPKTPAVKKLSARGAKRPQLKESTPETDEKTTKSRSRAPNLRSRLLRSLQLKSSRPKAPTDAPSPRRRPLQSARAKHRQNGGKKQQTARPTVQTGSALRPGPPSADLPSPSSSLPSCTEGAVDFVFSIVKKNLDESQTSSSPFLRSLMTAVCTGRLRSPADENNCCRVDTAIIQRRLPVY